MDFFKIHGLGWTSIALINLINIQERLVRENPNIIEILKTNIQIY